MPVAAAIAVGGNGGVRVGDHPVPGVVCVEDGLEALVGRIGLEGVAGQLRVQTQVLSTIANYLKLRGLLIAEVKAIVARRLAERRAETRASGGPEGIVKVR